MIHIIYMRPRTYTPCTIEIGPNVKPVNTIQCICNSNRIRMAHDAELVDNSSGFRIKGPQFMLIQLLFFLGVKVSHPSLLMEYRKDNT